MQKKKESGKSQPPKKAEEKKKMRTAHGYPRHTRPLLLLAAALQDVADVIVASEYRQRLLDLRQLLRPSFPHTLFIFLFFVG